MHRLLLILLSVMATFVAGAQAPDDSLPAIAIVGTGAVGSALGASWGALGHPIIYGSRTPDSDKTRKLLQRSGNARAVPSAEAAHAATIVVLAIPFDAALELLPKMGNLAGKIIIDPINALNFDTELRRVSLSQERVAERLQALAPDAFVVKALNVVTAKNMLPDRQFDAPISVPIAGNNESAKRAVAELIEVLGLEAMDVGDLFNARFVEAMAPLYVYMNYFHRPPGGFEYHFTRTD